MLETSLYNSLSIVIPTYNRENLLSRVLEGYLAQSQAHSIHELLVVDDGSTDATEAMVGQFIRRSPFPIRYLRQPNKGPAAARNFGIREAKSGIVLFTDSDVVPARDLVAQHLDWHRRNPGTAAAVLGYLVFGEALTPLQALAGAAALIGVVIAQRGEVVRQLSS